MPRPLIVFLMMALPSCSTPEPKKFNGRWDMIEVSPGDTRACLTEQDIIRLRELLIQCRKD
jgi:hypothetical protein